ncbi:hypothetical protein C8P63_107101 [Melghirimyces profundicolus]|uniref:Uncharacterized protein n=1 Tax=Melghirimyces profundicolus TaxID=1242148 RepID=A0A2T6BZ32_9BACL|nr:hypothetical protein [Melghirimyces profundicolus]PTX61306.1 hypothetical protein C8P63_107101 [Melghirimyces profundicolus]
MFKQILFQLVFAIFTLFVVLSLSVLGVDALMAYLGDHPTIVDAFSTLFS